MSTYRQLDLPSPPTPRVSVTDEEIETAAFGWLRAGNSAMAERLSHLLSGGLKGGVVQMDESLAERMGIRSGHARSI